MRLNLVPSANALFNESTLGLIILDCGLQLGCGELASYQALQLFHVITLWTL